MTEIAIIVCGLVATAFFAGTETAFVARLYRPGRGPFEWWRQHPERIFATTLVGTNLSVILSSSVATEMAVEMWGTIGELYVTVILSIVVLIFCETLPKSVALKWNDLWSNLAAMPMTVFYGLFAIVIMLISAFARGVTKTIEKFSSPELPEPHELVEFLKKPMTGIDEGRLIALLVFLRFANRRVQDMMMPIGKLQSIALGSNAKKAHEFIMSGSPYVIIKENEKPIGVVDSALAGMLSPDEAPTSWLPGPSPG